MKKTTFFKISLLSAVFGLSVQFAYVAHAATIPTLSLTIQNSGYVQMSVNGDPNSPVTMYYYNPSANSGTQTTGTLGTTNAYGYFSTQINDTSYNIPYNTPVYVNVDGQNSASVGWPNSATGSGGLALSQTNITVQIGQTTPITANNNYVYGTLVIESNSNPQAILAAVIGSQINITGANYGTSVINVCETGTNSCGTIYASVESPIVIGPGPQPVPTPIYPQPQPIIYTPYTSPISLSSNNININARTSQNVQIYGSGSYYIYQNSNPGVVTASLNGNGNWLSVYGVGPGTSNITICENNGTTSCAQLAVDIIANQIIGPQYTYSTYQPAYMQAEVLYPVQRFFSSFPWNW